MMTVAINAISILAAAALVGAAMKKWHIVRDRQQILSVFRNVLMDRKALLSGVIIAVFYLAVFMILGGKGGRIHIFFGRLIWNTTPGEVFTGLFLAILVMMSMALFVFSVRSMGARQSGKKSGAGFFGSLLALLVAFCPWWLPILSALGGAAGAMFLTFWNVLAVFSAAVLILSILYTAKILNAAEGWGWPSTSP